ncbi:MAG: 50S ribosomal protein L18 [Candidatus Nezhaarchaeota archaeon]|nr:50S ribosomal protein L18 [Candidatus Nezhaarchaeota archaeon]MCX8141757.1 50S ribosomal protein L18 [Candidatus Nezhaarchaeota archaeon]MDW8050465.1 50S ribosomal protein L18 [Nitrososphaerota archaeon]
MVKRRVIKRVPLKRRRKGLTNYRIRRKILLSKKPILVVRKTCTQIIVQVVKPEVKGDLVLAQATGKELRDKFGWPASGKNAPAAYLTGYLAALRALKAGIKEAILYIGLHRAVKGSNIFAALKGVLDAGLKVPHSPEVLPPEERIRGLHIMEYAKLLKDKNSKEFERQFSAYLRSNFDPEKTPEKFEETKKRIEQSINLQSAEVGSS